MRQGLQRLLLAQVVLTLAVVIVMVSMRTHDGYPGLAAAYGGAMAIISTLLLAWRTARAGRAASAGDGQLQVLGLMGGFVERSVFILVAFALGMAVFRLDPVALLLAFACAELSYMGAAYRSLYRR